MRKTGFRPEWMKIDLWLGAAERPSLLDKALGSTDFSFMSAPIRIDARWDDEARVWIATSGDAPGLVVEAPSWQTMIDEVRSVLPDLLELDATRAREVSLTFKAETHLALAAG